MDWRLRDVNVGLQGGKTFYASFDFYPSLIEGSMQAFLFVDCVFLCRSVTVLTETERNIRGATGSTLISIRQTDVDRLMIRTQSKGLVRVRVRVVAIYIQIKPFIVSKSSVV